MKEKKTKKIVLSVIAVVLVLLVLAADIACVQTMDLDLRGTMTAFLAGFHYA